MIDRRISLNIVAPNGKGLIGASVSALWTGSSTDWQLGGVTSAAHDSEVHKVITHLPDGTWNFDTVPENLNPAPFVCSASFPGYKTWKEVMPVPPTGNWDYRRTLEIDDQITVYGRFFWKGGVIWRYVGCSDFNLFPNFIRGSSITDILKQRVDLGFNVIRTFVYAGEPNTFALDPRAYNVNQVRDFLGLVNDHGLKVELTKGDAQIVLPGQPDQIIHQQMIDQAIGNNFNETCNEPFKNGIDVSIVIPHAGIRASGDYNDSTVHQNALDYVTYHGRRDGNGLAPTWVIDPVESVLDGFNNYAPMRIPFVHDEPMGFAENAIDGKRSNDPRLAFLLGDKIGRWLSGGTYHCDQGINSEIFTGLQLECAKQFGRGMNLAPLI